MIDWRETRISLRPESRHVLYPNTKRIARYDGGAVFLTCICGDWIAAPAGSADEAQWWAAHSHGGES